MSRLLITNIKKCGKECPFYWNEWRPGKNNTAVLIVKCNMGRSKEIKELEPDGFPKFCGLEKVEKK